MPPESLVGCCLLRRDQSLATKPSAPAKVIYQVSDVVLLLFAEMFLARLFRFFLEV